MFRTGKFVPVTPVDPGNNGFEMKIRKERPLGLLVVVVELLLFPQEIMLTLAATSAKMPIKILFKLRTPKSVKDRDLDARKRIITEPVRGISPRRLPGCKSDRPLVVF